MSMDTATLLDSLKARIEALVPSTQVSDDDRFRCVIGSRTAVTGARQVLLSAEAGRRKPTGGSTCNDWETTLSIVTVYPDTPAEPGQRGVYSHAIEDAEDMLADIYGWSTTTAGILAIEPDPALVDADGQGLIASERTIFIQFERS